MLKSTLATLGFACIVLSVLYPSWISDIPLLWSNRGLFKEIVTAEQGLASSQSSRSTSTQGAGDSAFKPPRVDATYQESNDFTDGMTPQPVDILFIAAQAETATLRVNGQIKVFEANEDITPEIHVAQILADAVVLDYLGSYLMLDAAEAEFFYDQNLSMPTKRHLAKGKQLKVQDYRGDAAATEMISYVRASAESNPLTLMGLFSLRPLSSDGQLSGFELAPGRNRAPFDALYLKPADQITAVNGYSIANRAELPNLLATVRDAQRFSATIERNGRPVLLVYNLERTNQ